MIDVKTEGLKVRFLPNTAKSMELLEDHVVLGHIIPKGFVFDGASYVDEDNNVRGAALLHDYFYRAAEIRTYTRKEVDQLFRKAMLEFGVSTWKSTTIYYGVRVGGGGIWKKARKAA